MDPVEIAVRARKLRRRRKRERQAVIFGAVLAALAAVGLGAAAVWSGAMESPVTRPWTVVEESSPVAFAPPCVEPGTTPVTYKKIKVAVYNGTTRAGLASSVGDLLGQRGFTITETANYPERLRSVARISFGEKGLARAYTLLAHVPGAELYFDGRDSSRIDLALGTRYKALAPLEDVTLDKDTPLEPVPGCVPVAEATPRPVVESKDEPEASAEPSPGDEATQPVDDETPPADEE